MIATTPRLDLNICRRKPFKVDLIDILKCEFTPGPFCLDHALLTPWKDHSVSTIIVRIHKHSDTNTRHQITI